MSFLVPVLTLAGLAIFVGVILALVSRLLKVEQEFQVQVTNGGNELTVEWGANLMEALKSAGYGMMASCGGQGVCGTCRVKIIAGLDEPTAAQLGPLKGKLRQEGWVLSCQTQVKEDLVIELFAPLVSSWPEAAEAEAEVKELSPEAQRVRTKLPGFDCGACGYETCEDYAEALVAGEAPPDGCIPGGEPVRGGVAGALKGIQSSE
ncbi:MAG: (Fe-S)-binding protein [Candidatus Bipolaricaulia bacterium]